MAELLPCPFCGSSASIERYGDRRQSTIYQCDNCSCSLETGEEWDHGREWNRRAEMPAPQSNSKAWTPPPESERPEGFECLALIPVRWQPSFENPARFEWGPTSYGITIEGMAKGWAPLTANSPIAKAEPQS